MNIIKFETNLKRNLLMHKTNDINLKSNIKDEENQIINIYPSIEFQTFMGFGGALTRCYML